MHVGPRHHDLAHANLAQFQGAEDDALFARGEQAVLAGLANLHLQLLGRVRDGVSGDQPRDAQRAHDFAAESLEQDHGPAKRGQIPVKRARNQERGAAGVFERDGLGHQFAEDDVQDGEEREGQDYGNAVGHERRAAAGQPIQHGTKELGEHRLAQGADGQAGERDAHLHAGDDAVELAEELLHDAGASVAAFEELPHARGAHRDQRELRAGEEAVDATSSSTASRRRPIMPYDSSSERQGNGRYSGRIALLFERIAVDVVAVLFPEAGQLAVQEFDGAHPLHALPGVEMRHHQAQRVAVVGRETARHRARKAKIVVGRRKSASGRFAV